MPLPQYTVTPDCIEYPELFRGIPQEPTSFQAVGDLALLNSPCIAIIGTRTPTRTGYDRAFNLAKLLAGAGYTIVSGLARGIDTAAHEGALASDVGLTIAVLATPITAEAMYPKENLDLSRRIAGGRGLLISEYTDNRYEPRRFFERDRLQSALSTIIIPVQCGRKSGTHHAINAACLLPRYLLIPRIPEEEYERDDIQNAGIRHLRGEGVEEIDCSHPEDVLQTIAMLFS